MSSLDEMAADPSCWIMLIDLIKSEQVPAHRMSELARDFPDFWKQVTP